MHRALPVDQLRRDRSLVSHRERTSADQLRDRQHGAKSSRSVAACVTVTAPQGTFDLAPLAASLQRQVRGDDRICTVGAGRLVVMFGSVDPAMNIHVLGARLASSASGGLGVPSGPECRVVVGVADAEPGTDSMRLTCAAIAAAESKSPATVSYTREHTDNGPLVVVTTLPSPDHWSIAHRVALPAGEIKNGPRRSSPTPAVPAAVFVVDAAPIEPGVPGPACRAVTSLLESAGLMVAGTLAPSPQTAPEASLPVWPVPRDALAVLVMHPGGRYEAGDSHGDFAFERPAALTHVLRESGMRVLAVSVGASDIALAECVVHGAEDAFGLGELPDGIARAIANGNGHKESAGHDDGSSETPRIERLQSLLLLTRSERRVLYHLTTGSTAIEIAENLVLSIATVRSHIRSILRKLEVSSQLAAVAIARGQPARAADTDRDRTTRLNQQVGVAAPGR